MERSAVIFILLISFLFKSYGQQAKPSSSKIKFEIGPQFSMPLNENFRTTHYLGFGATSRAAYYFTDEISTGIRINYDYFLGKKYESPTPDRYFNVTWTSLLVNFQYDLKKEFYFGGDAGIGIININGITNSSFNTSVYFGKAVTVFKTSIGMAIYWTQARESTSRNETLGLSAAFRFN